VLSHEFAQIDEGVAYASESSVYADIEMLGDFLE
jgi:hypothetical protein